MNLGDKIKKARKDKGISQVELANLCGLNRNSIYYYESDMRQPRIEHLQKIANALNVPVSELLPDASFALNAATNLVIKETSGEPTSLDDFEKADNIAIKKLETLMIQNPEADELIKTIYELTPEQRQQIINLLKAFIKNDDK